jgi:hypothetical protein
VISEIPTNNGKRDLPNVLVDVPWYGARKRFQPSEVIGCQPPPVAERYKSDASEQGVGRAIEITLHQATALRLTTATKDMDERVAVVTGRLISK